MSFDNNDGDFQQLDGTTTLSPEEYVERSGMACPGCGDTRFVKYSEGYEPELTGNAVTVRVECTECKATWTEEYTLTGYSNLSYDRPVPTRPVMVYDPLADISRANYNEPGLHTR